MLVQSCRAMRTVGEQVGPALKVAVNVSARQFRQEMGKSLRMRVLAEGVETQADADLLTAMGCDEAQGYFFGKPMPLHELIVAVKRSWRV